jgi:hypothetical protein
VKFGSEFEYPNKAWALDLAVGMLDWDFVKILLRASFRAVKALFSYQKNL